MIGFGPLWPAKQRAFGKAALVAQDVDEDAIAAFGVQPLDRLREDALIVQLIVPRCLGAPIAEFGARKASANDSQ